MGPRKYGRLASIKAVHIKLSMKDRSLLRHGAVKRTRKTWCTKHEGEDFVLDITSYRAGRTEWLLEFLLVVLRG